MDYDTWLQSGPGGPLDDATPEVFVCPDCGHETTDDREPCHCEANRRAFDAATDEAVEIHRRELAQAAGGEVEADLSDPETCPF
jgi:hypothetical protein